MPIYAYKCESCGHAKDVLQKMSDVPLSACPQCGAETFKKQLTAAGFQLKGSGWYVTDFRGGNSGAPTDGVAKPADNVEPTSAAKPSDAAAAPTASPSAVPASPSALPGSAVSKPAT